MGPGPLGLGLIATSSVEAKLDLHIVHPDPSRTAPAPPMFVVTCRGTDEEDPQPLHEQAGFCCGRTLDALDATTLEALRTAPDLLLTTSLGTTGLEDSFPLLLDMVDARGRSDDRKTVFIPCENHPGGDAWHEFAEKLKSRGVDVRNTMVNRLCYWRDNDPKKRVSERVVRADRFREWVIAGDVDQPVLSALAGVDHVRFVDRLEPVEVRKRWLVNGAHLGLALVARQAGVVNLNEEAAEPEREQWLTRLQDSLREAFEREYAVWADSESYAAEHRAVWKGHPDLTGRVLSRMKRAELDRLFADINRKLGAPARIVADLDGLSTELKDVFDALHAVLMLPVNFQDYGKLVAGELQLTKAADDVSLAGYEALLTGVVADDVVAQRVESLGTALAKQR
jgi:hypothetical protein